MARFYGEMTGRAKNPAKAQSAEVIKVHVRGWDFGIRVVIANGPGDEDAAAVYMTTGSNDTGPDKRIGYYCRADYDSAK